MTSKHVAPKISAERWAYLKSIGVGRGKLIHESAAVAMIPHPTNPMLPSTPWIEKPGHTYDIGRNKAKRAARVAA